MIRKVTTRSRIAHWKMLDSQLDFKGWLDDVPIDAASVTCLGVSIGFRSRFAKTTTDFDSLT